MRTRSWVSGFLTVFLAGGLAAAPAQPRLALPSGGSVTWATASGKTRLDIRTSKGKRYTVPVSLDPLVAGKARTAKLQLIGEKDAHYLILTDSYASLPLGMSMCQAGEETFLRVIALGPGRARQTFHRKLASCRENIELAEPGLTWSPETGTLRMHWLSAPQDREHQGEQTVQVAGDGTVQVR